MAILVIHLEGGLVQEVFLQGHCGDGPPTSAIVVDVEKHWDSSDLENPGFCQDGNMSAFVREHSLTFGIPRNSRLFRVLRIAQKRGAFGKGGS
jgi:hypothetical protein